MLDLSLKITPFLGAPQIGSWLEDRKNPGIVLALPFPKQTYWSSHDADAPGEAFFASPDRGDGIWERH